MTKLASQCMAAFLFVALIGTASISFADSSTAVEKDDAAIAQKETEIARDRATKAYDKATGNWAGQAIDSVVLGADHVMHTEKSAEKSVDQTIQNHNIQSTPQQ